MKGKTIIENERRKETQRKKEMVKNIKNILKRKEEQTGKKENRKKNILRI